MSSVPAPSCSTMQPSSVIADNSPWSPYPGLRPFQFDDFEYFYGRDVEVDQVVARLRERRFVAVIGGSGSGKSSLVLAGAIPRLRSFAIKDAGDFWASVVATPGTNHTEGDSPIRRLARKFCGELVESVDAAARLETCVALLRRPNGLGELIERFGGEIKNSDGVSLDLLQVNFLFLIDQFEELFHPSNAHESIANDCRNLVDRIVEQFKTPHPQVCVALTMRSEHLNDCTRYEGLPDAINAVFYLVKRLGIEQLRAAIEQPIHRYLRKQVAEQRNARRQARLEGNMVAPIPPITESSIPIDPDLIDRLLVDSTGVLAEKDHADHLPLLQHVLFWIWYEANARCVDKPLIDSLTLDDLWHAVGPMPGAEVQPLEKSVNSLEACLQNRCEAIFSFHVAEQGMYESVFRSLAFKEPNTGTYSQQRVTMDNLREQLGSTVTNNEILKLQLLPWMKPHGYLHWDVDSRSVKVAHETLIRRWKRFRDWIDEEDRQLHVYLRLLEDCERWVQEEEKKKLELLSGGNILRRYEDEQLPVILKDKTRSARINRMLGMDHDGQHLIKTTEKVSDYLDQSIENRRNQESKVEREKEQRRLEAEQLAQAKRNTDVQLAENAKQLAENAKLVAQDELGRQRYAALTARNAMLRKLLYFLAVVALSSIFIAAYAYFENFLASKERILHGSLALAAQTEIEFKPQFKELRGRVGPNELLRNALAGLQFLEEERQLSPLPANKLLATLIEQYFYTPIFNERLNNIGKKEVFSEARNTNSLSTILVGSVWSIGKPKHSNINYEKPLPCESVKKISTISREDPTIKYYTYLRAPLKIHCLCNRICCVLR